MLAYPVVRRALAKSSPLRQDGMREVYPFRIALRQIDEIRPEIVRQVEKQEK
jgi:hypothetical protein